MADREGVDVANSTRPIITCARCKRDRPHSARNLCHSCYELLRSKGLPLPPKIVRNPPQGTRMFTCTSCGEERLYCAKQLCRPCYRRMYTDNIPMPNGIRKTFDDHLAASVRTESGCLLWAGPVSDRGYGTCNDPLTGECRAHRAVYVRTHGPIPKGLEPDHRCHTNSTCNAGDKCTHRRCVEVTHLELVTHWENTVRSNSWGGVNYRKTHCSNCGEALTMYGGKRLCASCSRRSSRESQRRRRSKGLR